MYRCDECGHIFEEGEEATWKESRGEYWGRPCEEEMSVCPVCMGTYQKVYKCEICGSYSCAKGEKFCEECITKTIKKFKAYLDEFDENEKEILKDEDLELFE